MVNLTLGERYSAHVLTTGNTEIMVYCFQMPPNLNYVENLGTGAVGATGCFAIGGERLGGDAAIRACFCGARNRLGQWVRTGTDLSDDSTYKWMLPAAERTRRGCTTN